jgi:hypothetical protein
MRFGILQTTTNAAAFINNSTNIEQTNASAENYTRSFSDGNNKTEILENINGIGTQIIDVANPAISNTQNETKSEFSKLIRDDLNGARFSIDTSGIGTRINQDNDFISETSATAETNNLDFTDNINGKSFRVKSSVAGFILRGTLGNVFGVSEEGKMSTNQAVASSLKTVNSHDLPIYDLSGTRIGWIKIFN